MWSKSRLNTFIELRQVPHLFLQWVQWETGLRFCGPKNVADNSSPARQRWVTIPSE